MSGLEVVALGALAAGYFDSRLQIWRDTQIGYRALSAGVKAVIDRKRGEVNHFYLFEKFAQSQPNKVHLTYPEPVPGKTVKVVNGVPSEPLDSLFNVKKWTYKEVYDTVLKYSSVLYHKYGVRPGDVVAMDFVNKPEFIFVWLALWNLGAAPAFINYNLQTKALSHCVRTAKSKLFVVDEEVAANGREIEEELAAEHIPTVYTNDLFRAEVERAEPFRLPDEQRPNPELYEAACYIFTSGTTGLPKAAVMSWKKVFSSRLYAGMTLMRSDDTVYSAMPLYHSTAAVLGFLASMSLGAGYAIGHRFSTTTFWTQVKLSEATVIQYVGETCRYLFNAPVSPDEKNHKVRQAMGNGVRPDIWARFKERFNIPIIDEFYGATEFPMVISNHQVGEFGIGACGAYGSTATALLEKLRWRIAAIDPDTQDLERNPATGLCRQTLPNEPGEFLFKLNAKDVRADFQGYTGNAAATEEKIARDVFSKGDAWVRSGDLLRMNADKQIFFVDRMGDTFRWKSENVSTNEVEEAITELGEFKQAVVVGVKVPNHEGRAGFAVLELEEGGKVDFAKLGKHLLARLPRYAVPIFLKVVKVIETTGNNKVQKKTFRDQKIPGVNEDIYWLVGDKYELLTKDSWSGVENGKVKL